MELNKYQSTPESLNLEEYPAEIKEDFYNFVTNVPYIKNLISADRPRAADCPRDDQGRIIVDLTNPPIIEDTNYFRPTALYFQEHGVLTHLRPNPNPNSEYGKWVREEIRRCYMGYVRPSDGAWVTGDMYFFLNYCPIMKVKKIKGRKGIRVVDFPDFLEGQWLKFMYIDKAREAGKHGSELAARGRGKAHPYDEFIYTPDGVKQWKDIKVGDYIFGDNGKLTKVINIPFDDIAPIYELTLSSGYKVKCSEGHLWKVYSHCRGEIIINTKELLKLYKRPRKISPHNPSGIELDCTIPVGKGVEFPYNKTNIDPYTFGLLLGDGCFRNLNNKNTIYFTSNNEDFEIYKNIIPYNYIKYNSKYSYGIRINNIGNILKSYNLNYKKSEDKFIPDEYKYNSRAVRIALLKGLLDTDGTVTKGKIELVLSSRKMVEDVQWLCSSLGIATSNIRIKKTWYYNSDRVKVHCLDAYRLSIFSEINLFTLPRKTKLWSNRSKTNYGKSKYKGYKIVNIKYIGKEKAKCITVDNESHCYLINNFIVTHNSYTMAAIMAKRFILGEYNELEHKATTKVETFCASYLKNYLNEDGVLNKFESYIDFCSEYTQFPKKRLISSMNNMHWQMGYKDNNSEAKKGSLNEVIGISVKDSEGKLRGKRGAFIGLEEFGSFPNLIGLYGTLRPSMEDGDVVFGMIYAQGCVCAGTKVLKLNGEPVNIEDVNINDHLLGYNGNNYSNEKISWLSPKAYKECLHIKTSKNNELKCSIDHPILALNKDKFGHSKKTCSFYLANELKIGDTLLIPKVQGHFGNDENISNNLKFVLRPNDKGRNFIGKEFNNLQEVRIKSIDNIGIQRIYNMTADTTHTYITNGFISSNTAGDKESDFKAAQQIMYSPRAFNMYPIDNVYDKVGQGKPEFVYFYPAYLNRNGCYSKDGISDVTKAILEVLINRYNVKYNTSNTSLITKTIAEHPITPQEAIMKTQGNLFPVQQLNERINQIDSNPNEFDDVYVGTLIQLKNGKVEFKPTLDPPIREFPTEDNKEKGAIEIFSLPEIDREGNVYRDRYIMGHDPVDDDQSNTMSLTSTFVFDLFTDKIVAEYTGRQPYADDNFEIVRKLCLFYNAKCLYEAHPYSQKVNTPNGIKLWEDIKVGDTLFSPTKGEVTVIDIPVNKEMPIYKITLEDGRTIDASDNHKWVVYKENSEVTTEITTEQMMKEGLTKQGKYKFFIPEHTGVNYKSKILPIDPYVMGLILTKGLILEKDLYENKIQINLSLDDIKDIKLRIPYDITIRDHKCYFNIKDLNVSLREYFNNNFFSSPFISPLYLYSDTEQRLALLRGLMDGNGNPDIKGPTLFLTEYKELYENILSLARSLGIKCSGKVTKSGKYKILLYPVCRIFKLRNKAQTQYKYSTHSKNKNALIVLKTAIKSIEYSHKEWGKCVTVDSKDGLYLIGDYVVTHNCNKKGIFAYFSKMNCLYLLAETPQYLKDQQIIKEIGYGNKSRGVNATHSINNYADQLTREWLIKPVVIPSKDEEEEVSIPNLMFIKNRAFLQELASYNPNGNYDRIRAFGMVMLYRQEKIILYQGDMNRVVEDNNINNPANDDFFTINYDNRF